MKSNLAYQEEAREELIGGRWVAMSSPSLAHLMISGNIYSIFHNYLKGKRCTPLPDGATVILSDEDRFIPDMCVVCDPEKLRANRVLGAPDLVVEILSPSTAKNDRIYKLQAYERSGVREYWIVSPGEQSIEQYIHSDGKLILCNVYHAYPVYLLEDMKEEERSSIVTEFRCSLFDDLTLRLEDIFERVT